MPTARGNRRVALILSGALLVLVATLMGAVAACGVGDPPSMTATVDERSVTISPSSYCWNSRLGNAGECAEGPLSWDDSPLLLRSGEQVSFRFSGQESVDLSARLQPLEDRRISEPSQVDRGQDGGLVPLLDRPLTYTVTTSPGAYVVELWADFPRGDATYGVLLEVVE